jgi:hypothetical protein
MQAMAHVHEFDTRVEEPSSSQHATGTYNPCQIMQYDITRRWLMQKMRHYYFSQPVQPLSMVGLNPQLTDWFTSSPAPVYQALLLPTSKSSNHQPSSQYTILNLTMSSIFCCSSIQPFKPCTLSHEPKFRTFMSWAAYPTSCTIASDAPDAPSVTLAIQVVKQVNYGPLESKRYFVQRGEEFVEVEEKWLVDASFAKLNT